MDKRKSGSGNTAPDCLTCRNYEECGRAQPGTFCVQWQSKEPKPRGEDQNARWRRGQEADF